jgi:hypothetical protein
MKKKLKTKKNSKAIKRIAELLPTVLDSFGWYGIGIPEEAGAPRDAVARAEQELPDEQEHEDTENDETENDEENGEEEEPIQFYDRTDVEMAVDEVISQIIKEGLIHEFSDPKKPPKLSEMFAVLFGPKSEITQGVEYFEQLIGGYDDEIYVDDLKEAYDILKSVVEEISSEKRQM